MTNSTHPTQYDPTTKKGVLGRLEVLLCKALKGDDPILFINILYI